jgi:hypothetical protein
VIEEDGHTAYRVGLEVGPLRPEARRCLDQLLEAVMETLDGVTIASD